MRILFTFTCVLALGLMGCSETTGTGGSGGDGGDGGTAGDGGNGGTALTDCTGAEDSTECAYGVEDDAYFASGRCLSEFCFVDDCVAYNSLSEPMPVDGANCLAYGDGSAVDYLGLCVDGTCVAPQDDCTGQADGTPCWFDDGRSEMGTCDEVGVCREPATPEIEFVGWRVTEDCDPNASGQSLAVTVPANDADTPMEQLKWSGQVQDCTPDLNAMQNNLSCDVYLGARQSEVTVTDPQGHQDTILFGPDPCRGGCVPGSRSCP